MKRLAVFLLPTWLSRTAPMLAQALLLWAFAAALLASAMPGLGSFWRLLLISECVGLSLLAGAAALQPRLKGLLARHAPETLAGLPRLARAAPLLVWLLALPGGLWPAFLAAG